MTMTDRLFSRLALGSAALVGMLALSASACRSEFPTAHSNATITMELKDGSPGTPTALIPLNFSSPDTYTFDISAIDTDGNVDTTFEGYVRLSSHPGTISQVTGKGAEGRNVQLKNGVAKGVAVDVLAAYGETHIWAEDIGYTPADPLPEAGAPEPQCADGIDNNGNGLIDFPADPGCAYANDDSEDGGTYATGISEIIYYASPRVADVRGVAAGGSATAFPNEQVDMDTGYRTNVPCKNGDAPPCYDFSVIVTRISQSGFYVTDISDKRGFSSVYAYNFSAPPNMSVCDRMNSFGGTASDFYGFTEVNYPTWSLDEWRGPSERPCGVPEPYVFQLSDIPLNTDATPLLLGLKAALVRVQSDANTDVHVGVHFGSGKPAAPDFTPTDDASDCDLNGDGKVDFTAGTDEDTCSNNCDDDPECSEYSNYIAETQFKIAVQHTDPTSGAVTYAAIQGDVSAAAGSAVDTTTNPETTVNFDPLVDKGKTIQYFTGTLDYFSGGSQFTIQARCPDDVVLKGSALPSDKACVAIRTASEFTE
jgi:hypothetical protein